jgi:hypothetical protein
MKMPDQTLLLLPFFVEQLALYHTKLKINILYSWPENTIDLAHMGGCL